MWNNAFARSMEYRSNPEYFQMAIPCLMLIFRLSKENINFFLCYLRMPFCIEE